MLIAHYIVYHSQCYKPNDPRPVFFVLTACKSTVLAHVRRRRERIKRRPPGTRKFSSVVTMSHVSLLQKFASFVKSAQKTTQKVKRRLSFKNVDKDFLIGMMVVYGYHM
ncbi:hypothetical protein L596_029155 [Steinernema carpocapsae]|uniref:Uncharacterized protein n=1 Tax=Steinernema carpocapsae TaxID=34508 RepID=A0A4V5ZXE2_STECR|nr:hypothetical protein L596_029155 [Steinernema carpocapsae]